MNITNIVKAKDRTGNSYYFYQPNGSWSEWCAIDFHNIHCAISNFSSKPAEFYIALNTYKRHEDIIDIFKKYADYLVDIEFYKP